MATTPKKVPTGWRVQVYLGRQGGRARFKMRTFPTRLMAEQWAREVETARDKGEITTPEQADTIDDRLSVGDYWTRSVLPRRRALLAKNTVAGDVTHWRLYLGPAFGTRPLTLVRRGDVNRWVTALVGHGVGVPTIDKSVHLLSAIYTQALDDELVTAHPCHPKSTEIRRSRSVTPGVGAPIE